MQFRSSQIYIRHETRKLLRLIAKARGKDESVDEVGDELLTKAILAACPDLKSLVAEMESVEDKMVQAIAKAAKPFDGTEGYM